MSQMIGARISKKKVCAFGALAIFSITSFTILTALAVDSDEYLSEQWYYSTYNKESDKKAATKITQNKIELISGISNTRKGNQTQKSNDTVVAVLDTLVDWSHEDLEGKAWTNLNEISNDGKDNDRNGYIDDRYGYDFMEVKGISSVKTKNPGAHGTAITGVICGNMNNGVGIEGISGDAHVKVMNLVVLDSITTEGRVSNLIAAIKYAEENGAKICNISSNYDKEDAELCATIKQSKMLFVVSAGNRPTIGLSIDEVVNVPAMYNFNNVVTVSAMTQEFRILRQANYGVKTVDILAPGDDILAPLPDDQYAYFSGTSIATPIVTGIAALLDQNAEHISASDLKKQILALASHDDDFMFKIKDGTYLHLPDILFH